MGWGLKDGVGIRGWGGDRADDERTGRRIGKIEWRGWKGRENMN